MNFDFEKWRYYPLDGSMSQGPPAAERVTSPWRSLRDGLSSALSPVIDFLFPPACLMCGEPVPAMTPSLCAACCTDLAVEGPRCQRCAAPVGPHLDAAADCIHCRGERFTFRRALALGIYDGPLRQAVLLGKHPHGAPLVTAVTDLLVAACLSDLLTEPFDVVIPVPHHWRRRFWRVHTPAETIAERLSRRLQRPYAAHILRKPRATPKQSLSPPSLRRLQQRGAFEAITTCDLTGFRVLLVDDVMTTGATANAAATALKSVNVADVIVAVLARTVIHRHVKS